MSGDTSTPQLTVALHFLSLVCLQFIPVICLGDFNESDRAVAARVLLKIRLLLVLR